MSENSKIEWTDHASIEDAVLSLLASGELSMDEDGRIWRHRIRRGNRIDACAPRRAERRTPNGYLQVRATIGGKRLHAGAHRVVFRHFKGPIPEGFEVNHDNGQKADNRPRNLLLSTSSGNAEHAHRSGLIDQYGQKNPSAKLSDKAVAEIRLAYSKGGYTQTQLAEQYGVSHQTVSKVVRGQRRPKQLGPVHDADHRHASEQDPQTGRFVGKKAAGRLLEGREWNGVPS